MKKYLAILILFFIIFPGCNKEKTDQPDDLSPVWLDITQQMHVAFAEPGIHAHSFNRIIVDIEDLLSR